MEQKQRILPGLSWQTTYKIHIKKKIVVKCLYEFDSTVTLYAHCAAATHVEGWAGHWNGK